MPVTQEGFCPAVKWASDAVVVEFVKQLFVGDSVESFGSRLVKYQSPGTAGTGISLLERALGHIL